MRHRSWIAWLTLALVVVFVPLAVDSKPAPVGFSGAVEKLVAKVEPFLGQTTQTRKTQQAEQSPTDTPIESIVQGQKLSNTYYYHFDSDVSTSARRVFEHAIAVYNQTGLVKLVAGTATTKQNSVTFFVYSKQMSSARSGLIESGHGGPKIVQQTGWESYTVNHARAGLNVYYPKSAIRYSVATHELGHALGLDHSSSRSSVMYPVDQGVTTLSAGDIAALKTIYGTEASSSDESNN